MSNKIILVPLLTDMLAVPYLEAAAMENWGLITFKRALLSHSNKSGESTKLTSVIAHERDCTPGITYSQLYKNKIKGARTSTFGVFLYCISFQISVSKGTQYPQLYERVKEKGCFFKLVQPKFV